MSGKTTVQIFQCLEKRLAAAGNGNPKRSVEELAAHVLGCKPLEIYFRELSAAQEEHLEILINRAEPGEPIQYIIGCVDFRGLEIRCDRRALIPRPETELLVEAVLSKLETRNSKLETRNSKLEIRNSKLETRNSKLETRNSKLEIADVGTGTGCMALSLLHELPNARVTAIDISPEALGLAKENAERLGLADRITFAQGNLLDAFMVDAASCRVDQRQDAAATFGKQFDIVVSNPPYVFSNVWKNLEPCVRDFEPQRALDGGADGMDLIRPLVSQAARVLKPGGGLFIEMGHDQGRAVFQCLENAGFQQVEIRKDLAGLDRIVLGKRR
jgi:release factor glutamine methyltransferase